MQPSVSVYWIGRVQCYATDGETVTTGLVNSVNTNTHKESVAEPALSSSLRWCQSRGLQRGLLSQRQSQEEDQLLQRTRGAVARHLRDWPVPRYQPQGEPLSSYGPAGVTHPGTWPPLPPNSTKLGGSWVNCTRMLFHMGTYSSQTQRGAWLCRKPLQFLITPRLCFQMHPAQEHRYRYQAVIFFPRL